MLAAALRCLGGDMQVKLWSQDGSDRKKLMKEGFEQNIA
jgi:fructose-1,6-bisphosphatase/sedoheptulose 1,7-bisphosphatase-like protein